MTIYSRHASAGLTHLASYVDTNILNNSTRCYVAKIGLRFIKC